MAHPTFHSGHVETIETVKGPLTTEGCKRQTFEFRLTAAAPEGDILPRFACKMYMTHHCHCGESTREEMGLKCGRRRSDLKDGPTARPPGVVPSGLRANLDRSSRLPRVNHLERHAVAARPLRCRNWSASGVAVRPPSGALVRWDVPSLGTYECTSVYMDRLKTTESPCCPGSVLVGRTS